MSSRNSRPLNTFELVEHFLTNALEIDIKKSNYNIIPNIVTTELNIDNFDEKQITFKSRSYRNLFHRSDRDRVNLQKRIVQELLTKQRLSSDDKITLGKGGAIPNARIQQDSQAYILIGLPASGKSTIANAIADKRGAVILDSDYAKRKLPEYNSLAFGATLVHEESTEIIFGSESKNGFKSLLEEVAEYKINIIIPKIGNNPVGIIELINTLKIYNYQIHLTLIELDRKKATLRALERFKKTRRYVPLGLIFDSYSNNPTITYYNLKREKQADISSFGILSTDVAPGEKPVLVELLNNNPSEIYK